MANEKICARRLRFESENQIAVARAEGCPSRAEWAPASEQSLQKMLLASDFTQEPGSSPANGRSPVPTAVAGNAAIGAIARARSKAD